MKRVFIIALLTVAASSIGLCQSRSGKAKESRGAEQELAQLEKEYLDARMRNDRAVVERILADDFVSTDSGGQVGDKAYVLAHVNVTPGGMEFKALEIDDVKVRVYGDTAVMTGRRTVKTSADSGQLRFTHVFVKRQRGWQLVAAHATNLPQQQPSQ